MGRKGVELEPGRWGSLTLLLVGLVSFVVVYIFMLSAFRPPSLSSSLSANSNLGHLGYADGSSESNGENGESREGCYKGIQNLELWGAAVKWGTDFKFNSSEECCKACKAMCTWNDGPCLCDSWVFCGNKEACGEKFGECWLKKQKDVLVPEKQETRGGKSMWTSGIIFGRGEGIVGLETKHGTLHIKLLPDCSPRSVAYVLELLTLRHCAGCHFYRAEGRGQSWDIKGNHLRDASVGPPYALIQGTLEAQGMAFDKIQSEHCPTIRRGSVAWVGSGPEFFISLAKHEEWKKAYTVFGYVLEEDMAIAEKISQLPSNPDVWNNVNVSVLEKVVPLKFGRTKLYDGELNLKGV